MRFTIFATALIAALTMYLRDAIAYEAEDEMLYEGSGTAVLRIISTTDIDVFEPLVTAFQRLHPDLTIRYVQASSTNVFTAITNDTERFDIAISSAMDLQTKAANDGYVRGYSSAISAAFPAWSKLRDQVFGFTQEPAVLVASENAFDGLIVPKSRPELIEILRANPDRFRGKIGTYDVRTSGLGYLFATQDARQSDGFWRLAEVIGALSPKLYCCSSSMIEAIETQEILLAYNVLGPYAQARININGGASIIPLTDYTNIMMRSVLIPEQSKNPVLAGQFIDFLLGRDGRVLLQNEAGLPPLAPSATESSNSLRPIRLGPGLLVYLDQLKRKRFLTDWEGSFLQK
jgi:iron(III) transport system substrate-binding protein